MPLLTATAAHAQQPVPRPTEPVEPGAPARFTHDMVQRRARDLAQMTFDGSISPLPDPLAKLDFDGYRDIRFRPERSLLTANGGPFRMQMFHPGFLFQRTVTVNVVRDGVATPVPFSTQMFDYGRTKLDKPLPVNLGFAGFRLHYPLNAPDVHDELIAFLGASYFRFLGRDQRYGLSARGLAIDTGTGRPEEFPFFREFWIEPAAPGADRIVIHALLDSPSITGAYRFVVYPGAESVLDVSSTLYPRTRIEKLGIAPLTSMFFTGENDKRFFDDFRPEVHDSDGLMIQSSSGEWIWRPLRNPVDLAVSTFMERSPKAFGLMQRDRIFERYEDLEANYELRPGYLVEPVGDWGEGRVELVEIPTDNETNDNIVALWVPAAPVEAGQTLSFNYRIRALSKTDDLHPGAKVINTHQSITKAISAPEQVAPNTRRFIVDFAGGDLAYYLKDPDRVEVVPTISNGRITRTFIVPNPHTRGFRAAMDIEVPPGESTSLRAFLRTGDHALSETWTYPWQAPG